MHRMHAMRPTNYIRSKSRHISHNTFCSCRRPRSGARHAAWPPHLQQVPAAGRGNSPDLRLVRPAAVADEDADARDETGSNRTAAAIAARSRGNDRTTS